MRAAAAWSRSTPWERYQLIAGPKKMLPDVGMDVATESFGPFGGRVFLLTQPTAGAKGLWANHLIAAAES